MMKLLLGMAPALLLAACSYMDVPAASQPSSGTVASGAGHPSAGYPGPKAY